MNEASTISHIWAEAIRVAGISHYVKSMEEIDGFMVELVREPENPYDNKAIAIFLISASGRKMIGHVPKGLAAMVRDDQLPAKGAITWRCPGTGVGVRVRV